MVLYITCFSSIKEHISFSIHNPSTENQARKKKSDKKSLLVLKMSVANYWRFHRVFLINKHSTVKSSYFL